MAFCCCDQDQYEDLDFWYMGNRFDSSIWSAFAYYQKEQFWPKSCGLDPNSSLQINWNKEKEWPVINRWIETKGEWTYKYGLWQEGFSAGTITPEDVYGIWTRELTEKKPNSWTAGPWGYDWSILDLSFYVTKTQIRGNGFKWRHNPANRCLSRCAIKSELCDPQYPDRNYEVREINVHLENGLNPCTGQPFKICDCYDMNLWANPVCDPGGAVSNAFADLVCHDLLNNGPENYPWYYWDNQWDTPDYYSANHAYWQVLGIPGTRNRQSSQALCRSSIHDPSRLVTSEEYHMANLPLDYGPRDTSFGVQIGKYMQSPYTHYFDCTKNGGSGTGDQDPNLVWCPSGICRNAVCSQPGLEYCCKSQEYFVIKEVEGITFTLPGLTAEGLRGGWDIQCAIAARESELCLYEAKAFRMYTPMEIDKTPTPPFFDNKSWKSTEPVYHSGKTFDNCNDLCEEFKFPGLDCEKANHFVWRDSSYITTNSNDWQTNEFEANQYIPGENPQLLEGQCWACISYYLYPWRIPQSFYWTPPGMTPGLKHHWIDTPECGGSTGNCCEANPNIRGCSVSDCCIRVCYYQPQCCIDGWGITCENVAKMYCPSCGAKKTDYGPFDSYGMYQYSKTYCTAGNLIPNSCDCKRENVTLWGFTYAIDIISGPNYLDQIMKTSPYNWKTIRGPMIDALFSWEHNWGPPGVSGWGIMRSKRETNAFKCDNCIVGTSNGFGIHNWDWDYYAPTLSFRPSSTAYVFDSNWRRMRNETEGPYWSLASYHESLLATTDLAFTPMSWRLHHRYNMLRRLVEYMARTGVTGHYYSSDQFPYQIDHNPYFGGWGDMSPVDGEGQFMPNLPYMIYFNKWNDNHTFRYTDPNSDDVSVRGQYMPSPWSWTSLSEGFTCGFSSYCPTVWEGFNNVGYNIGYWTSCSARPSATQHRQVYYGGDSCCCNPQPANQYCESWPP